MTKLKLQPNNDAPDIREEWDFTRLDKAEESECFRYEYFRESPKLRQTVDIVRKLFKRMETPGTELHQVMETMGKMGKMLRLEKENSDVLFAASKLWMAGFPFHLIGAFYIDNFGFVAGFPETPWQLLDDSVRRKVLFTRREVKVNSGAPIEFIYDPKNPAWRADKEWLEESIYSKGLVGLLAIRPGFSQDEIVKDFRTKLSGLARSHPGLFRRVTKRNRYIDHLQKLGALRLLKLGSATQAKELAKEHGVALYNRPDAWSRAKGAAQKLIQRMEIEVKPLTEWFCRAYQHLNP